MVERGITLIELLICLLIAGVILHQAAPAMSDFVARQRATAAINSVIASVQLARTSAVIQRLTVTFCPRDGASCGSQTNWSNGGWIFADRNRNVQIDDGEVVYGALPGMSAGASLTWRAFRNRSYLRFRPSGLTDWQNGHFLYCPEDRDVRFARALILNVGGRARLAPDTDGDGIAEGASGRPLQC